MRSLTSLSDYDLVITEVFKTLHLQNNNCKKLFFNKKTVEDCVETLVEKNSIKPIRDIPDIKYSYDARRDFPSAISTTGYWAITGCGKGKYHFEKIVQNNLLRLPEDLKDVPFATVIVKDKTPTAVASVLGNDEQATLTRIRYNNLLTDFLGFTTHQVQGHERTSLSCGQIEVDEIYVGDDGSHQYVIPISGKGGDTDFLSFTQALNLSLYAKEKTRFKGYIGKPLGVWQKPNGPLYIVEFSCAADIHAINIVKAKAYTFVT